MAGWPFEALTVTVSAIPVGGGQSDRGSLNQYLLIFYNGFTFELVIAIKRNIAGHLTN